MSACHAVSPAEHFLRIYRHCLQNAYGGGVRRPTATLRTFATHLCRQRWVDSTSQSSHTTANRLPFRRPDTDFSGRQTFRVAPSNAPSFPDFPSDPNLIIDERIPARYARIVREDKRDRKTGQPKTSAKSNNDAASKEPQLISNVLAKLNRKKYCLLQVEAGHDDEPAICKIVVKRRINVPQPPSEEHLEHRVPAAPHPPLDEEIQTRQVQLVDPDTGRLGEPQALGVVLSGLNRQKYFLVQLSLKEGSDVAICRVRERSQVFEDVRQRALRQSSSRRTDAIALTKTLEVGWQSEPRDLTMKLNRARAFLEQGKRVSILVAAKHARKEVTIQDGSPVLRHIREEMRKIPRVRESRPSEGKVGVSVRLYFERLGDNS